MEPSNEEVKRSTDFSQFPPIDLAKEFIEELQTGIPETERALWALKDQVEIAGWPSKTWEGGDLDEEKNLYVCVSSFKWDEEDKRYSRKIRNFGHGLAVFFDDVGRGKGSKGVTLEELPLEPTAIVETSPDNYQIWYFLEEPVEFEAFNNFQKSRPEFGDESARDLNRFGRIPLGINNKTKHLKNGKAPRVHLLRADYFLRYTLEQVAAAYRFEIKAAPPPVTHVRQTNDYDALCYKKALEVCTPSRGRGEKDGKLNIKCVWDADHSTGNGDGAYIWGPDARLDHPYGYKCMHESCNGRSWAVFVREVVGPSVDADAVAELEQAAKEWDEAGDEAWKWICAARAEQEKPAEGKPPGVSEFVPQREAKAAATGAVDSVPYPYVNDRPTYRTYERPFFYHGKSGRHKAGTYFHGVKYDDKGEAKCSETYVCSPLHIRAYTRNLNDSDYGRYVEIVSPDQHKSLAIPMEMLAGDWTEVLKTLVSEGVKPGLDEKWLRTYLVQHDPEKRKHCTRTTGWWNGSAAFVLPRHVIGSDEVVYQALKAISDADVYSQSGSVEEWRSMAALATGGNTLLTLSLCAAFAGPLLKWINLEGAGLHLFGDSTAGKTTVMNAGVSVWGSRDFRRSWKATANGLEAIATLRTDVMLAVDESSEVEPKALDEALYMLINGKGKMRMLQSGSGLRNQNAWRVFVLSTGETTLGARLAEGNISVKTGQELRILDVPVGRSGSGEFPTLHGYKTEAEFTAAISNLSAANYGFAGPAFVKRLISALRGEGLSLGHELDAMLLKFDYGNNAQLRRGAKIFAICAAAGELAAKWGVLPWDDGVAAKACVNAFGRWRDCRASNSASSEGMKIRRMIREYINTYSDSRFSDIAVGEKIVQRDTDDKGNKTERVISTLVQYRAGYWKKVPEQLESGGESFDEERKIYLFYSKALDEAAKPFGKDRIIEALKEADALYDVGGDHKAAKVTHVPGKSKKEKFYYIDPYNLDE